MNSTSRACRFVRIAARSPGRSRTGPGRRAHRHAQLVADDVRERGLAEPGRTVEQHVVERLAALPRGRDRHLQVLAHALLADVVAQRPRPQPRLVLGVVVDPRRVDEARIRRHLRAPASFEHLRAAAARTSSARRVAQHLRRRPSRRGALIAQVDRAPTAGRRARRRLRRRGTASAPARRPAAADPSARARSARPSSCRRRECASAARCPP